jgi:hypothetical protein
MSFATTGTSFSNFSNPSARAGNVSFVARSQRFDSRNPLSQRL